MKLFPFVLVLALLTGCDHLPYPREMGDMAPLRTMGVDKAGEKVSLTLSTGPRAQGLQGERQPALTLSAEGETLSAAALSLQSQSDSFVFFGYVDQLLLGEELAGEDVRPVLDWFARDLELGLGAQLWVVQGREAASAVKAGGDEGTDSRLETLEHDGEMGVAAIPRRAGEVYTDLLELGAAYVPALIPGGGEESTLLEGGYAILKDGALVGYLKGEGARGLELLAGEAAAHILAVELPQGRVTVRVTSSAFRSRFGENGLELSGRVSARLVEHRRLLTPEEREQLREEVALREGARIRTALTQLQVWGADCLGLGARAGLTDPAKWSALRGDWPREFARQEPTVELWAELRD